MGNEFIVPVGSVIKEYLDEYHITQKELSKRMGMSEKQISKFMTAKSRLTEEVALKLEMVIPNLSASFLLKYECKYREYVARKKQDEIFEKQDLKEIAERFEFKEVFAGLDWDQATMAQEMLKILKISSFDNFESAYQSCVVGFKEDGGTREAIAVWLGLCEEQIDIQNEDIDGIPYDAKCLEKQLDVFKLLAKSEDITALTESCRKICNDLGIYLVFHKPIHNCKVRGALTTFKGHPAIYLSGRFKSHDHIWFAFMHEIGHLLLHYGQQEIMVSFEDSKEENIKESQADMFARDYFIDKINWDKFVEAHNKSSFQVTEGDIRIFAKKQKVHPGIIVARLQHDHLMERNRFNNLKVKMDYEDF